MESLENVDGLLTRFWVLAVVRLAALHLETYASECSGLPFFMHVHSCATLSRMIVLSFIFVFILFILRIFKINLTISIGNRFAMHFCAHLVLAVFTAVFLLHPLPCLQVMSSWFSFLPSNISCSVFMPCASHDFQPISGKISSSTLTVLFLDSLKIQIQMEV